MKKRLRILLGTFVFLALPAGALVPRVPFDKVEGPQYDPSQIVETVTLKFHEGTHVRLRDGQLVVLNPDAREAGQRSSLGLTGKSITADLGSAAYAVASTPGALGIERTFPQDESTLAAWRIAAENRSGLELADLDLYYRIPLAEGATMPSVASLLNWLNSLASVELAQANAPLSLPSDIAPPTPNFDALGYQGYLDSAAAGGIDARYAWTIPGGRGGGIRVVDVEYAWRTTHEDFPPVFYVAGNNSTVGLDHGTSVIGVLAAPDNGYGVTGIANQASVGLQSLLDSTLPPNGYAPAILKAAQQVGFGDVLLLELQAQAAPYETTCPCAAEGGTCARTFVPVEFYIDAFDAIRMVTAGGTIVVEAGANGSNNLDHSMYGRRFDRNFRDSGAILVAASKGSAGFGVPVCTSNYGSRIDVHAWGKNIATLARAHMDDDLFTGGGDPRQTYTSNFANTSGASPIVAGAAAVIQGAALASGQAPLSPSAMRALLRETGTPQSPDARSIGPIPNLRAALGSLGGAPPPTAAFTFSCAGRTCAFDGRSSTETTNWTWSYGDGSPTGTGSTANHTYSTGGDFVVRLTAQNSSGQVDATEQTVRVGLPPVASFTVTCAARICEADGTNSTFDLGPLSYQFAFGGPGNSDYLAPGAWRFTYNTPGTYEITLRVTDTAQQIGETTKSIVVRSDGVRVQVVGIEKDVIGFRLGSSNSASTYVVTTLPPTSGLVEIPWPLAGDWNSDGIDSIGKFDPGSATFYLRNSLTRATPPDSTFVFGDPGADERPIAGDWNGDGLDTVGVFDPGLGIFRLRNANASGAADVTFVFSDAQPTWLPIAGDWNGDGVDTVGLYDPATSTFYLRNSNTTGGADLSFAFGPPGSNVLPLAGDWNCDGWDSIGLYDVSSRRVLLRNLNSAGAADSDFATLWEAGGKPIAGDWDGI